MLYAVHIEEGDDCTPSAIGVPVWAPICAAPWRANRVWSIMESLRVGIRVPDVEQARTFYCGLVFRKSGLSQAPTRPRSQRFFTGGARTRAPRQSTAVG